MASSPTRSASGEPFVEGGERLVVVALAGQGEPAQETAEEQWNEQAALAREREPFVLQAHGLGEVARPVPQQTGGRQRQRMVDGVAGGAAERHRLVECRVAFVEDAGDAAHPPDREMGASLHGHGAGRFGDRQRFAGEANGRIQVASAPRRAHAIVASASPSLTRSSCQACERQDPRGFGGRPVEVAHDEMQARFRLVDGNQRRRGANAAGQLLGHCLGFVVQRERLARREAAFRLPCRRKQVGRAPSPTAAPGEVIGEHPEMLREPIGIHLLDGVADARCNSCRCGSPLCVVRHLLRQRMLEHVRDFRPHPSLVDQFGSLERIQPIVNGGTASATTRSRTRRENSRPITDARCSRSRAGGSRRSSRARMTSCTVSGTSIVSVACASPIASSRCSSSPRSCRERTISSTKNGLPSVFASRSRCRSGDTAGTPSSAPANADVSLARGATIVSRV